MAAEAPPDRTRLTGTGPSGDRRIPAHLQQVLDWVPLAGSVLVLGIAIRDSLLPLLLTRSDLRIGAMDDADRARGISARLEGEADEVRQRVQLYAGAPSTQAFAESTFDAVVIGELLHGSAQPEAILQLARRILRPGGRLIVSVPAPSSPGPHQTASISTLVEFVRTWCIPERVDVVDGHLQFVGRAGSVPPDAWDRIPVSLNLLRLAGLSVGAPRSVGSGTGKTDAGADKRTDRVELDALRRRVRSLSARNAQLNEELQHVYSSKRYRIGDALVKAASSSSEAFRLPARLWRIYREPRRPATAATDVIPAGPAERTFVAEQDERFAREFDQFVAGIIAGDAPHFVAMFGGTTFIQGIRANRPIRLTTALARAGVHVLLNYHRDRESDEIPPFDGGHVFQSPIDKTPSLVEHLLRCDLRRTRGVFITSYPHPSVSRLVNLANAAGWVTLYDCRDDWEEFQKVGAAAWYRSSVEKYIVNNCDTTCCVSRTLQQKMASLTTARPVHLLPNAFDPDFIVAGYRNRPATETIVGYFGHLTEQWFDWPALGRIARQRPHYRFEIIGHGAPQNLDLPVNVALLGPKVPADICKLAARWKVAIIPFRTGRLADSVDPIKIYEYFGLGLPVVSFRMPQIATYPYTTMVDTEEAFLEALDRAKPSDCDLQVFQRFLAENTWDHRARQLLEWADHVLDNPSIEKSFHSAPLQDLSA